MLDPSKHFQSSLIFVCKVKGMDRYAPALHSKVSLGLQYLPGMCWNWKDPTLRVGYHISLHSGRFLPCVCYLETLG